MTEEKFFQQLDRAVAPPGFEQVVLAKLREQKTRRTRLKRLEFSLAGLAAMIIAAILIFSPVARKSISPVESAAGLSSATTPEKVIHLMEPIDLKKEMRRTNEEGQTVFILEQVSDNWVEQVKY
ncbi:MAG: hypothetical protein ACPLRA_00735 [Candidatus Saccharicenans sp.]